MQSQKQTTLSVTVTDALLVAGFAGIVLCALGLLIYPIGARNMTCSSEHLPAFAKTTLRVR